VTGPIPVGKIAKKTVCQKCTPKDCFFGDFAHGVLEVKNLIMKAFLFSMVFGYQIKVEIKVEKDVNNKLLFSEL